MRCRAKKISSSPEAKEHTAGSCKIDFHIRYNDNTILNSLVQRFCFCLCKNVLAYFIQISVQAHQTTWVYAINVNSLASYLLHAFKQTMLKLFFFHNSNWATWCEEKWTNHNRRKLDWKGRVLKKTSRCSTENLQLRAHIKFILAEKK